MKNPKQSIVPALALLAAAGLLSPAAAQFECEVPLFVQEVSIDANVMILFDNSGSMAEAVFHPDYNNDVAWSGSFNMATTYYISSSGMYAPRNVPGRPSAANQTGPLAPLVRSFGQQGRYSGRYLNWIFYHATDAQRATLPQLTLINVAHDVVADIIQRTERVRFGLTIFNFDNGGTIVAECGADKATLVNTVRNIQPTAWTPLAESMETIVNYYRRTGSGAPIIADCQKSFVVVVTDGLPTQDLNVSHYLIAGNPDPGDCVSIGAPYPNSNNCSRFFPEVTSWLYNNDVRPDLPGTQNVISYTIGFNIDAPLLAEAAIRGGGLYMSAMNAVELWTSLELVMLDIINRISAGSAVAVVSTERSDEDRLYRGKFMPGTWHGYLESFTLPYTNGDTPVWEAGYLLMQRAPATRVIYAGLGGNMINFTTGQTTDLMPHLGIVDHGEAADVIRWTRGENVNTLRDRNNWKLGDIIHSTPVVVGAPANFVPTQSYQLFMEAHEERDRMIYVGANDGMLHAFDADTGQEAWAFVPQSALPKLATIASDPYCHTYTVDLTPSVRDCLIDGAWRTVLVGGGRQGGAGYFALDITDPQTPALLWQATLPLGKPFGSEVAFAVINNVPVVLIGSGLDTTDGRAALHVYAVRDGSHLGSVSLSADSSRRNKTTAATAVDLDFDGNHDVCYVADLQGHVWKLAFNNVTNPTLWDRYCLWQGDDEITGRPTAAFGPGPNHDIYVYFGTGAYLVESDISTREDHIFGCIFDRHDGSQFATLVNQTYTNDTNLSSRDGWYIELRRAEGERVTEPAVIVSQRVYFTSFVPSQEVCAAGGQSWLYRIDFRNGRVHPEDVGDDWNNEIARSLGQGIASRPVVDLANESVIVQSSDATIHEQNIEEELDVLRVRAWQEDFDFGM